MAVDTAANEVRPPVTILEFPGLYFREYEERGKRRTDLAGGVKGRMTRNTLQIVQIGARK
jgi:hypothetical protein